MSVSWLASASAQAVLDDIVVTAQKRVESLQEVPISINTVDGDSIQNTGIERLEELTAQLPNITVTQTATGDQLYIRGIGSGTNTGFEQSVGTFIDGVYFGRDAQSRSRFFDVERVEVLRGPQSTYFGQNTIAGALNITTRRPGEALEGYASALYEFEQEEVILSAAVGGPLSDTFGLRVAGQYSGMKGWVENVTLTNARDEPDTENYIGRFTGVWTPTDQFDATVKLEFGRFDEDGRTLQADDCPPPAPFAPGTACGLSLGPGSAFGFDGVLNDKKSSGVVGGLGSGAIPEFGEQDTALATLTVDYEVAEHVLTSLTAYSGYELKRAVDLDVGPLSFVNFTDDNEYDQISQELRIASPVGRTFEYLAGLYFQSSDLKIAERTFVALPPPAGGPAEQFTNFDQDEESLSVFGSLTWNITDSLRGTVGLRYTEVEKELIRSLLLGDPATGQPDFARFPLGVQSPPPFAAIPHIDNKYKRKDDDTVPSFNIQYMFNDDIMVYGSYAEGFKAGGFDQRAADPDPANVAFDPETVKSYELGAKTALFDGAMTLNIAGFISEYKDLQVSVFTGVGIVFFVDNAAESTTQGIEIDWNWAATENLTFKVAASYLDASYDSFPNGPCSFLDTQAGVGNCPVSRDFKGENLTFAPDYSGYADAEYIWPLSSDLELLLNLNVVFSDEFDVISDNDVRLRQDSYAKLNARVALSGGGGIWEIGLVGRNLNDEETSHFGNDMPTSPSSTFRFLDRTRSIAIQGRYNF